MTTIKETPVFVNIGEGTVTNTTLTNTDENNRIKIDVFNGDRNSFKSYVMKKNPNDNKFTLGTFTPFDSTFNLGDCLQNGTMYLNDNQPNSKRPCDLVVGTHIGQALPSDELNKKLTIKMSTHNVEAKMDFVYVNMTTGVNDSFGKDSRYAKRDNNKVSASDIRNKLDTFDNIKCGFYHYLTGFPTSSNKMTNKQIGEDQALKFLKAIAGYDETTKTLDTKTLDGALVPVVIFMDNVTQANYFGAAPNGVKKNLDNF